VNRAEATGWVGWLRGSRAAAEAGPISERRGARSHYRLTVPILLLALCFAVTCGWILWEARRATETRAVEVATSVARTLRFDIARHVETLNLSLVAVANNLKLPALERLSPEMRQLVLFDRASSDRFPTSILVVDASGQITYDSKTLTPSKQNLSDREHFKIHMQSEAAGLFISRPLVSRLNSRPLVAFSRRLSHPDGSFAGIVLSAMLQDYFQEMFRDSSLGPDGSVTLVRTDGIVLMRWPYREDLINSNIKRAELFNRFQHASSGHFQSKAVTDGVERLFVYAQVDDLPLIVVVGQSLDDVFQPWWRQALAIGILMAALCAVTVMLALLLNREFARRSAAERKLTVLATTDGLTGLANRRHFNRVVAHEWRRAMRNATPVALLMIDADDFKLYNDSHGHQAGDQLLQAIAASIMATSRRPSDLGVRFGGDEFALLLPDTSLDDAAMLAGRLRDDLAARCNADGAKEQGRLSIGVASLVPTLDGKHHDLIAAADKALYQAKRLGRNRTELAETVAGPLAPVSDGQLGADIAEASAPVQP
jgi:diguanylate cyclase (GGDEF)-like protein